jgi:predicted DCC family thiol-disulfide oxidoreductase YuxK
MRQATVSGNYQCPVGVRRLLNEALTFCDGVILFDGNCRFCINVVAILLRLCSGREILVCSTRSDLGKKIATFLEGEPGDTFAFITQDEVWIGVDAYSAIFAISRAKNTLGIILGTVTNSLSTRIYRSIASNRSLLSAITKLMGTNAIPSGCFVHEGN